MEEPFALVFLDVLWEGDYVSVDQYLLEDVLREARSLGAEEIEHVFDTPPVRPQFQHHPEKRMELLEGVGFDFRRETGRLEWRGRETPAEPGRLSFRTLEEVREDAFVDTMERVRRGRSTARSARGSACEGQRGSSSRTRGG